MERIPLICAQLFIFLFFIVFNDTTVEIKDGNKKLSDIILAPVESNVDETLKSNKLQHKNYYTDTNNHEEYNNIRRVGRRNGKEPKIWDQWGNWSTCSVTCGIGKITRWRHCISGSCALGEKKAQLKTCTFAAC